jgi:FKBP-type peptidyl-prolyl cis-trans isomerase FkpA
MRFRWLVWTSLVLVALSCDDKNQLVITPQEQLEKDIATIDQYLADNGITAVQHPSGLRIVTQRTGNGEKPTSGDCVRLGYTGRLLNSPQAFEENQSLVGPIASSDLIRGWRIGLKEVEKGGKITLYIPSGLAYGNIDKKNGDEIVIPKNSILVFDIELFNITKYNSAAKYCYPWP